MMEAEEDIGSGWRKWVILSGFTMSSAIMVLLNQAVMMEFRDTTVIILSQNISTVLILHFFTESSVFNMNYEDAIKWLPCAVLYCVNLQTSLMSLLFISAPTFLVLRNMQPILACVSEMAQHRRVDSLTNIQFLFSILVGTAVYASNDLQFDAIGYSWAFMHVLSMTFYAIVVRSRQDQLQYITISDMSMYNNALTVPFLSGVLIFQMPRLNLSDIKPSGWFFLGSACVCAVAISTSGLAAQKILTPTSWLALNNLCKVPAILLSYVFFGGFPTVPMLVGMGMALMSGYFFALSRMNSIAPVHAEMFMLFNIFLAVFVDTCSRADGPFIGGCGVLFDLFRQ